MRIRHKQRETNKLIAYLYENYNVPKIPVYVYWRIRPEKMKAEGAYFFNGDEPICIEVYADRTHLIYVLTTIAHEFVHYMQHIHRRDMKDSGKIENDAEYYGMGLVGLWQKGRPCAKLKVWEEHVNG